MKTKKLPLKELSISEIYYGEKATYEIPIYQRNYAWERDEIYALIQDIYDAFMVGRQTYFVGTLVSFHKGEQVYEVIDGQQRLTTIYLILKALGKSPKNKLTYRARRKSDNTIKGIPEFEVDDKDYGIVNGYEYAINAINGGIVPSDDIDEFTNYFLRNVHLIHYQVPKDIDLNHYFEIMNTRGEQLEQHEIIKARLLGELSEKDKTKFNRLWEYCSEMNVYIQQKYRNENIFGNSDQGFMIDCFDSIPEVDGDTGKIEIKHLIERSPENNIKDDGDKIDTFQPIIDFPNFLLIVLKLTRLKNEKNKFNPSDFTLDDKELIAEFDKIKIENKSEFTKQFGFNLLKAKFLLDNYIVHHSNEDETNESNPWELKYWHNEYLKNLDSESDNQNSLVHLLSMFEVSFTARQRKNYLFYCMLYLFDNNYKDIGGYRQFVSELADKYFKDIYLVEDKLNQINTPNPGSFDETIISDYSIDIGIKNQNFNFNEIYGDGTEKSKGIPLFIFNYLDYKLWEKYSNEMRGEKTRKGSREREEFFDNLGCSDFGLEVFKQFYFSRTRRSLEHFYPTALLGEIDKGLDENKINCFGNYAMIGSEVNSSGSNWTPKVKLDHYLDASGKIKLVSVASLKFMIMMQKCKDNDGSRPNGYEWNWEDIQNHQEKMLSILNCLEES